MNDKTTQSGSTSQPFGQSVDRVDEFAADMSAWMDGELSGARARLVAQGMAADAAKRSQWGRYHLIGDVLRDNLPASGIVDISSAVRAEIEKDELAIRTARVPFGSHPRIWGLAASLVLASVVLFNSWQRPGSSTANIATGSDATTPVVVATAADAGDDLADTIELDQYLRNHTLALVDTGEPARMLPYLSMAESAVEPVSAAAP
ncbi:MAG TPA: sigma-E factor negative regulatory protein [Candidatus Acidoferrales bacterium]|nr:sigma-E factor negative regulatory protein [Candidatus Acidoferrales bacterium]